MIYFFHTILAPELESGDDEKKEKSIRSAKLFYNWAGRVPELRYLQEPEHVNDAFAIMQHYGIPTNYIDFTTDPGVAGFFAADTKNPPSDDVSCIYCLNTDDLMSNWDIIKDFDSRKECIIELVKIDVRNLWRLQAQHGVFLFSNYRWDIDYPMDRILFPYTGYPSYPTRERIYPEHKSSLEQLLDQYFVVQAIADYWKDSASDFKANVMTISPLSGGFKVEAFIPGLAPHQSWSPEALGPWENAPEEDYHQTIGQTLKLRLDPQVSAEEIRKSVSFGVRQIIRVDPAIRYKTVDWVFSGLPESLPQEQLNNMLRPVWDGMRRLPYTDSEIADACGSVTKLMIMGLRSGALSRDITELFSQCFGECIKVEFGNQDGSYSRGLAANESLRKALRPDFAELLTSEYKRYSDDVYQLFNFIYNPRLMFDFNKFRSIFSQEVIPAQIALERDVILFNLARLKTFGLI